MRDSLNVTQRTRQSSFSRKGEHGNDLARSRYFDSLFSHRGIVVLDVEPSRLLVTSFVLRGSMNISGM